ncbi:DUF485 domain-containing protein [Actinomadura parmotrematis]|uniref:DUF485 domain-containing protein n=1 Tax=Actinomadura parmotrematis TaxID=2864039 RepID=UPI003559137C
MTTESSGAGASPGPGPAGGGGLDEATYLSIDESPEFARLRSAFRRFVFPMTAAFLVWYLLYVVLSAYARGFMGTKVFGNVNVALLFGLLQFVSTFLIAWLYERYARNRLEPLADGVRAGIPGAAAAAPAAEETAPAAPAAGPGTTEQDTTEPGVTGPGTAGPSTAEERRAGGDGPEEETR